jgi:lipid-A-disaccharide synthase
MVHLTEEASMGESAPTIWIVAGETSGDGYGARLAHEMRALCPDVCLKGMGGPAMREAGVEIMVDSSELGVMGLVEVFKILRRIIGIFRGLVKRASEERPDTVVLIDYPGFNLRLARKLHALGIRVVYYVSPQVWAWKKGRIPKIAATVDRLMVIFPFEPAVYEGTGLDVQFVGHPLLEILAEERDATITRDPNTMLLLPGSRRGEIDHLLPTIAATACLLAKERPHLRFVMPLPRQSIADYASRCLEALPNRPEIEIEIGNARHWMQQAGTGLATSGTVTVEAAILGLPLVSVYRVHPLTYLLAAVIIRLPYFTMVNLIAGRQLFPELLQGEFTPENALDALRPLLPDGEKRADVEQGMRDMVAALGGTLPASRRAALSVLEVATREA